MTSLSELQQRVADAGERLRVINDERRKRGKQLSNLTRAIEEDFVRKERLVKSLREKVAGAQEDHRQLRGMLDSLLAATERANASRLELGAHISHLIETASSLNLGPNLGNLGVAHALKGRNASTTKGETSAKSRLNLLAAAGEEDDPLKLTQMIMEDDSVVGLGADLTSCSETARKSVYDLRRRLGARTGKQRRLLRPGITAKY